MPSLKFRQPCNDCPWRRNAASGWLGADTPEGFMAMTLQGHDCATAGPCHQSIDYGDPDWRETQYPQSALCVGALQFLNNWLRQPYGPDLVEACRAVGTNENVFARPEEFLRYHSVGDAVERQWMMMGNTVLTLLDGEWLTPDLLKERLEEAEA